MPSIAKLRVVVLFTASLALAGCATAPKLIEPAGPTSAMAVLSRTVTLKTLLGPQERAASEFAIGRLNADGTVDHEILQTNQYKNYVFFENLAPGKYKVLRAVYIQRMSTPIGSSSATAGRITTTSTTSLVSSTLAYFRSDESVTSESVIEVPAGSVVYMGDYSGVASIKMAFPMPKLEEEGSAGGRTEEGKRRASEMLKTEFADSPWAQRPIKD